MKLRVLLWFFLAICIIGCSKDESFAEEPVIQTVDFTVIGQNEESLFEYSYETGSAPMNVIDLSSELSIEGTFLTLRQVENTMSYYSFSGGDFSLAFKDMNTGKVDLFPNFFTNSIEKSIVWGTNSKETIHLGFYNPSGSTNVGLRNIDIPSFEGTDLQIDFNVENLYQPLYHDKKLFITYKDVSNQYKVQVYNLDTRNFLASLNFGEFSPSLLINEEKNLAVIKSRLGNDAQLEIYDFDTLSLIESTPIELERFFSPGELDADLVEGKLYYSFQYAQPSTVNFGPAIYNIDKKEEERIDMRSILAEEQDAAQKQFVLTVQGYSKLKKQFYVGYISDDEQSNDGGVLVISEAGELIENVTVPFAPIYFLKD